MSDIIKELDKCSKPHEGDTYTYIGVDFPLFEFSDEEEEVMNVRV